MKRQIVELEEKLLCCSFFMSWQFPILNSEAETANWMICCNFCDILKIIRVFSGRDLSRPAQISEAQRNHSRDWHPCGEGAQRLWNGSWRPRGASYGNELLYDNWHLLYPEGGSVRWSERVVLKNTSKEFKNKNENCGRNSTSASLRNSWWN